jgi:hypothetical protein
MVWRSVEERREECRREEGGRRWELVKPGSWEEQRAKGQRNQGRDEVASVQNRQRSGVKLQPLAKFVGRICLK